MSLPQYYSYLSILQTIVRKRGVACFLVGGFLRDFFLNKECFDLDFAVAKDALKIARLFADAVKGAYVLLDQEHGCARVAKKIKGVLYTFDFADFRAKTLAGDLGHRDFTVNTLALDIHHISKGKDFSTKILDKKGARKDLKKKTVRQVSAKAFREDPLRILRAFSLRAVFGFTIERATLAQIKKDKHLLKTVSDERISEEFFKILKSARAYTVLKDMHRAGVLQDVIPQIHVMFGVKQGGYHHLDVWKHSLEVIKEAEAFIKHTSDAEMQDYLNTVIGGNRPRYALIKLACLLHDIGKPDTRARRPEGGFSFYGHERAGKHIARPIAKLLKISVKERHLLENLIFWHLRPGYLSNYKAPTKKSIYRFFRETGEEAVSVLLLSLADQRATRGPLTTEAKQKHHEKICLRLIHQYFEDRKKVPLVRLVNGDDLIRKLKLKPSPLFQEILSGIEEQQTLGKITTKAQALELAKDISRRAVKQERKS